MKLRKLLLFLIITLFVSINSFASDISKDNIIFTGSGDDIITITKGNPEIPYILYISGNTSGRHFSIVSYDGNNTYLDLLVNTSDNYVGAVPIDLSVGTITKMLEIKATGKWQIIVLPLSLTEHIEVGEKKSYKSDNVLWIDGEAKIAKIFGNLNSKHFSVIAFDKYGNYSKLLVNTSELYSGSVLLPKDTLLLQVTAVGDWNITLQ